MGIDGRSATAAFVAGRAPFALAPALVVALALAGCTVGPNFRTPETTTPAGWAALDGAGPAATTMPGEPTPTSPNADPTAPDELASRPVARPFDGRRWWAVFADPTLDGLVDSALRQNLDLQAAAARLAEARAQRDVAAGAALPTVGATGLAGRQRMSENGIASALTGSAAPSTSSTGGAATNTAGSGSASSSNLFQAGFDALWELDLWGKARRGVEAANATTEAAEAARGDAMVSLTAEVVRDYLALRGAQREQAIVEADIAAQQRSLALVESQADSGLAPRADAARQAAQLAAARAQRPPLVQAVAQSSNRLALLLAEPPGALRDRLAGVGTSPGAGAASERIFALPPEVPVGLPGELLRRRPDVARSEAELHAATARVGVAEASLFPSIQLGAVGGLQSTTASHLADWGSRFFLAGAQISMPVFQGGRLKAQVKVADARLQQALLAYRQTVLAAFHDADDALVAYAEAQRQAGALARQSGEVQRARRLIDARYRAGLAPYTDVLLTDLDWRRAQLAALQAQVQASTRLVALYKTLGGDWDESGR